MTYEETLTIIINFGYWCKQVRIQGEIKSEALEFKYIGKCIFLSCGQNTLCYIST